MGESPGNIFIMWQSCPLSSHLDYLNKGNSESRSSGLNHQIQLLGPAFSRGTKKRQFFFSHEYACILMWATVGILDFLYLDAEWLLNVAHQLCFTEPASEIKEPKGKAVRHILSAHGQHILVFWALAWQHRV